MTHLRDLADLFAGAKGCKTSAGARMRVYRAFEKLGTQEDWGGICYFALQRHEGERKGEWLAVVLLNDKQTWMARFFADHGCCVTKI